MAATKALVGTKAAYEFSQPPAAVPARRPYRDTADAPPPVPVSLMNDRRVVRGNTFAAQVLTPSQQAEAEQATKKRDAARKQREYEATKKASTSGRPRTPEAVSGRVHADAQTDSYLETLSDKVPESESGTQTEAYMDRPPSPLFVPAKVGVDKSTAIAPGELFDFDREVAPILAVLVGKTLEQSIMEVHEETELANIRARQREFEQVRNLELAEVQRLEAEVRRKEAEKKRRVEQEKARIASEAEQKRKVEATSFARQHVSAMVSGVFDELVTDGHFFDPLTKEVEDQFLPGLYDRATQKLSKVSLANQLADDLIAATLALAEKKRSTEVARVAAEKAAIAKALAEAEAARAAAEAEAKEKARLAAEEAAKAENGEGNAEEE